MSTHRKSLNLVTESAGIYAVILRGGRVRRYKKLTPASLNRARCIVRNQLNKAKGA